MTNLTCSKLVPIALALAASLAAILVRVPLIDRPLDRDEGLYAYMAQRMARGEVPYRDVFSDKPPVGFVLYWAFFAVGGETARAAHWGGAVWAGIAALFVALAAYQLGASPGTAALAAWFWAVHCSEATLQGSSINLELLLTPFALSSIALLARPNEARAAAAGFLMGIAGLTKQQAIGHAFFGLTLLWMCSKGSYRQKTAMSLLYAGGGAAALCVTLATFTLLGAAQEFLEGVLWYNVRSYVRREPLTRAPANLIRAAGPIVLKNFPLYLLAVVGMLSRLKGGPRRAYLIVWAVASFAAVSLGFRYYPHYFLLLAPAVCIAGARGVCLIQSVWVRGLLAAAAVVAPLQTQFDYYFRWSDAEHVRALYGPELFHRSDEIARHVANWTSPNQTAFVFGSEPQIYFLANRKAATKYAFIHPLTVASPEAAALQRQLVRQLQNTPPATIVVVLVDMSYMWEPGADDYLEKAVAELCRRRYRPVAVFYHETTRLLGPGAALDRSILRSALAVLYVRK